jgi:hypothetical protein
MKRKLYMTKGGIKASSTYNDLGFNSFFKTGWKRFTSSGMNRAIHLLLNFAQKQRLYSKHYQRLKRQCLQNSHLTAVGKHTVIRGRFIALSFGFDYAER